MLILIYFNENTIFKKIPLKLTKNDGHLSFKTESTISGTISAATGSIVPQIFCNKKFNHSIDSWLVSNYL